MRWFKRAAIALVGGTVLFLGILMIALPGPAFLVIPAGLAILALEFAWAREWLQKVRALIARLAKKKENPPGPDEKKK